MNVMLIDDSESFRNVLCRVLEASGHVVTTAQNGAVALELYQQKPFDLVITDLIMPGMEGIETIIALRRIRPNQKIIAISGGGLLDAHHYLSMARELGASRVLAKPFTAGAILATIASVVEGQREPPLSEWLHEESVSGKGRPHL